jgi:Tfp pilus assembly protein PilF
VKHERPDTDTLVRDRLRANADDVDALFVLAALRLRDGDVDGGLSVLERVLRIDPRYPGAWIFKAKLHRLRGDSDAAEAARRNAEVNEP